jgi:hypothetical protein
MPIYEKSFTNRRYVAKLLSIYNVRVTLCRQGKVLRLEIKGIHLCLKKKKKKKKKKKNKIQHHFLILVIN